MVVVTKGFSQDNSSYYFVLFSDSRNQDISLVDNGYFVYFNYSITYYNIFFYTWGTFKSVSTDFVITVVIYVGDMGCYFYPFGFTYIDCVVSFETKDNT